MNRCKHCGAILADDDKFCGNCGHQVFKPSFHSESQEKHYKPKGIIMTDSVRLARKFNVSQTVVLSLLRGYIDNVSPRISYQLLDTFQQPSRQWQAYHQALYKNRYLTFQNRLEYLFIIGSDDIIPVPEIRNCMVTNRTEMVPTDILYGYNISYLGQQEADVNILFQSRLSYHVGRLPLGTDATLDQLQNYMIRSASYCHSGVPVQLAYGQCDPHWKLVSSEVVADLKECELLPDIEAPASVLYDKLLLSPYITCETIGRAFNRYSNLYYFNMHGSDHPERPFFLGASLEDDEMYPGIGPETIGTAKYDNIVITEACYGGKYIRLETRQSMLLSAIFSSTMFYLGSSVVAYGTIDKGFENGAKIGSADIMAKEFISNLMKGYSAGDALHRTRQTLFEVSHSVMAASNLLTIYEFSLYGDPSLKVRFPNQKDASAASHDTMPNNISTSSYHIEQVYGNKADSILAMVRSRVDSSLASLQQEIQRQLTEMGIRPRQLESISRVRFGISSQHMFSYTTENGGQAIVVTDDRDHSKTVLMPKADSIAQNLDEARRLHIDYASIFQDYSRRFGLIQPGSDEPPTLNGNGNRLQTVYLDPRIEPRSKLQIKTFNTVLDQVYRPEMQNRDIAMLGTKTCDLDFSPLVNPLAVLLETELRVAIMPLIRKKGTDLPSEATFGRMVECFKHNTGLLADNGITGDFLKMLDGMPKKRNDAAHKGGTTEELFLAFYERFIKIVTSPVFTRIIELKIKQ